jgi:hypothetical protein
MKKFICLFAMLSIGYGLFAFDRSLNGSWGLTEGKEKEEIIRFNTNEIVLNGENIPSSDYSEGENTIYVYSLVIQYYLLSSKKMLLIMWDNEKPENSMVMILTKL